MPPSRPRPIERSLTALSCTPFNWAPRPSSGCLTYSPSRTRGRSVAIASRATAAKKPTRPRFTPATGTPRSRVCRSARSMVPSPPSTRHRSAAAISSRDASQQGVAPCARSSGCLARSPGGSSTSTPTLPQQRQHLRQRLGRDGGYLVGHQRDPADPLTHLSPSPLNPGRPPRMGGLRRLHQVIDSTCQSSKREAFRSTAAAEPDDELPVAARSRQARIDDAEHVEPQCVHDELARSVSARPGARRGRARCRRLPTRSRPASNWGLTSTTAENVGARVATTAGSTFSSEMNETSAVNRSAAYGTWSAER